MLSETQCEVWKVFERSAPRTYLVNESWLRFSKQLLVSSKIWVATSLPIITSLSLGRSPTSLAFGTTFAGLVLCARRFQGCSQVSYATCVQRRARMPTFIT